MDPFRDCRRLYTEHFEDRLAQRYVPPGIVEDMLRNGSVSRMRNTYAVNHRGHRIILVKYNCRLLFKTIFKI